MTANKLRDDMDRLRAELDDLAADSDARARLDGLLDSIEERINLDSLSDDQPPLVDAVKDAIHSFEAEHPRATAILNDIMVALSNMGI